MIHQLFSAGDLRMKDLFHKSGDVSLRDFRVSWPVLYLKACY